MYRVLIAEDEILVRLGIKNLIDWEGLGLHIIADVDNGQDALRIFEEENPEIVITDIKMPIMDGMELIRRIRTLNKDTKIVILSCLEDFELARSAITYGVSEYISKVSMSSEDIEKVVIKLLDEIKEGDVRLSSKDTDTSTDKVLKNQKSVEKKLKSIILSNEPSNEDIELRLKELNSCLGKEALSIIIFEVGNYDIFADKVNFNILLDMLKSKFSPFFNGEIITDDSKKIITIVNLHDVKNDGSNCDRVREFVEDIQNLLNGYFGISAAVGISSRRDGFQNLKLLFSEASEALRMKFCCGNNSIFTWKEDIRALYNTNILEKLEQKQSLLLNEEFIQSHRISFYKSKLNNLIKKALDSDVAFLKMFFQVMYWHSVELTHSGMDISELLLDKQNRLIECETLDEFFEVFEEYIKNLNDLKTKNKYTCKEIIDAVTYMEGNCHKSLTLQEVADYTGISPNYLSSLFKKQLNEGFVEHLTKLRIQKAKELLFETNLKLYEIAIETGFSDEAYFSRIFKKYTGKSPIYFRRQYMINFSEADNETI